METLWQDLRYGARMLLRSPAFTAAAVLSLALGIGANTTIFTFVNALFLHPLPVAEPARLVAVFGTDERNRGDFLNFMPISYPNFEDYRDQNEVFSGLFAYQGMNMSLTGTGEPQQLQGLLVSGNYFDVLGVKAALGRTFLPEEDRTPGTHPVVVLSHGLWQRRFGSDPGMVGQTLSLNRQSFTVVGVAPENFKGTFALGASDFWVPMAMHDQVLTGTLREWFRDRRALLFFVTGRLKSGISREQAEASLKTIGSRLEREYPRENEKRSVSLLPLDQATINPNLRAVFVRAGALLMVVVGLVLLIACANLANLLLARAAGRASEIAIRLALGASRGRLVRQLLTESLLISVLGSGCGLLLAVWARELLWSLRPPFLQNADHLDLSLDLRVLGFTAALSLLAGLLFGLAPALQSSRSDLVVELKERSAGVGRERGRFSLRNLLVVAQIALSLLALLGAGLFLRSLRHAQQLDPGFETGRLAVMSFDLGAQGYDEPRGQEFYRRVRERVEALPGVESASVASDPPFGAGLMRSVTIEGEVPPPGSRGMLTLTTTVGANYFETAGIPLLRGRGFTETDRGKTVPVAIVNEAMARRFWPGQEAVGRRFKFFGDDSFREVVGVARDSDVVNLGEDPRPLVYLSILQNFMPAVTLHLRTAGDPTVALAAARREVQALDPNLPLVQVRTVKELVDQALWAPRMGAVLLSVFGLLALLLAAIGIYGVLAYSVSQRTAEIGIRMALGAQRADVLKLVLGQGLALVGAGIGLGLGAGFAATRLVANMLYGVSAVDAVTFTGTPLLLALVALVACSIPARRATRIDPVIALRQE